MRLKAQTDTIVVIASTDDVSAIQRRRGHAHMVINRNQTAKTSKNMVASSKNKKCTSVTEALLEVTRIPLGSRRIESSCPPTAPRWSTRP